MIVANHWVVGVEGAATPAMHHVSRAAPFNPAVVSELTLAFAAQGCGFLAWANAAR
jgi:hypothetical protein